MTRAGLVSGHGATLEALWARRDDRGDGSPYSDIAGTPTPTLSGAWSGDDGPLGLRDLPTVLVPLHHDARSPRSRLPFVWRVLASAMLHGGQARRRTESRGASYVHASDGPPVDDPVFPAGMEP